MSLVICYLLVDSTRLQLISGCIFIQLNQAPPWQGVDLVDREYERYAVLLRGSIEVTLFMQWA